MNVFVCVYDKIISDGETVVVLHNNVQLQTHH